MRNTLNRGLAERTIGLLEPGDAGVFSEVAVLEKPSEAGPARKYEPLTPELRDYVVTQWTESRDDLLLLELAL